MRPSPIANPTPRDPQKIALRKPNSSLPFVPTHSSSQECLELIEQVLSEFNGMCEYPIYVKALIKRQQGKIQESLQLFQAATALNPHNVANLKQVGRSLYLLGKHKAAVDVYEEAQRVSATEDWEIWHNKGLCYMYLKQYDASVECFRSANDIQRHDTTYRQMGKVFTLQERYQEAVDVYLEALEFSQDNPELLTTIGLLYLRMGENYRAFEYLGNSLAVDPKVSLFFIFRWAIRLTSCFLTGCKDDLSGGVDHPGPQRHGRGAHKVPRRGGQDTQQRTAVEQRGDVLLR